MNRTAGSLPTAFGTTDTTVATLTLPAGSYLLFGKAQVTRVSGTGTSTCKLFDGSTLIDSLQNQGSTSGEAQLVHAGVTLSATSTITMRCAMTSGTGNASNRTLSAFKLSTLTVQ